MTKFRDFKALVEANVNLAVEILTVDISYGMGMLNQNEEVNRLDLSKLDDAYDNTVYIYLGKYGDWMLYANDKENQTTVTLGMVSGTYERYQAARFLADLYLTFYQNFRVY